jgi:hypothetical protein
VALDGRGCASCPRSSVGGCRCWPGRYLRWIESYASLSWRTGRLAWRSSRLSWRAGRLAWRMPPLHWPTGSLTRGEGQVFLAAARRAFGRGRDDSGSRRAALGGSPPVYDANIAYHWQIGPLPWRMVPSGSRQSSPRWPSWSLDCPIHCLALPIASAPWRISRLGWPRAHFTWRSALPPWQISGLAWRR